MKPLLLVSSSLDPAGQTIRRAVLELAHPTGEGGFTMNGRVFILAEVPCRLIHLSPATLPAEAENAEGIIFLSRHQSRRPFPVLTVHAPGNFSTADLGGETMTFPPALTGWMHSILRELRKNAPRGYAVTYEVTHHGPTSLKTPCCFVEIGSTEQEWQDAAAGKAVAMSVLYASIGNFLPLIGFGGTHYARRQTEIALATQAAFGHIAASRDIQGLGIEHVRMMADASGAVAAYIDAKSLPGDQLREARSWLSAAGLPVMTEGEIRGMGALTWEEFQALRALAETKSPGGTLHAGGFPPGGDPVAVWCAPPELFAEAVRADLKALMTGIASLPVAWVSGPSSPVLPVFLCDRAAAGAVVYDLIRLCVTLLLNAQDTQLEGDDLLIRRQHMDPDRVRELGIPPGPLLGALSSGKSVHAGGRMITPDMVHRYSLLRIHVPGLMSYL